MTPKPPTLQKLAEECADKCNDCLDAMDPITVQTRNMEKEILATLRRAVEMCEPWMRHKEDCLLGKFDRVEHEYSSCT